MNEITHHLVARAKRTDGTLGSHYLVNSVHRLRDCKTLFAVLCELSKPGLPAFALAEKKLPGLPLTECATRQKDVQVFAASSYKERSVSRALTTAQRSTMNMLENTNM